MGGYLEALSERARLARTTPSDMVSETRDDIAGMSYAAGYADAYATAYAHGAAEERALIHTVYLVTWLYDDMAGTGTSVDAIYATETAARQHARDLAAAGGTLCHERTIHQDDVLDIGDGWVVIAVDVHGTGRDEA